MLFICVNLAVSLIDWCAFTTYTLWYSIDLWGLYHALIVVHPPDAVVVCVADIDFDVASVLVIEGRDSTGLVKARLECCLVNKFVFAIAQPREDLVAEGIHDFNLVIISVCYNNDVLLWYEVHTERVLQFGFDTDAILVTIRVQVSRIVVPSNQVPRTFQSFHVHRANAR